VEQSSRSVETGKCLQCGGTASLRIENGRIDHVKGCSIVKGKQ
jgi:hypothetical protein